MLIDHCTIEGNKALITMQPLSASCTIQSRINRCNIRRNHAQSVFFSGNYRGGEYVEIAIGDSSEVTMNNVTLNDNLADDVLQLMQR